MLIGLIIKNIGIALSSPPLYFSSLLLHIAHKPQELFRGRYMKLIDSYFCHSTFLFVQLPQHNFACSSRVDDGIPPLGPRQSLCCRKGARREVSLRLCREDCHRQSSPTTTCGCRGFESRHANAQQKAPYLSRYGAYLLFKGGRWDSNPRQPEPQSGALPLNYVHHCVTQRAAAVYTVARWDASQILHLDAFFYFEAEKRVVISL